jgi:tight adherence protein B
MERAGLPLLGSEFIVISLIVGAVAGAAVFLVTMDMPLGAIGLAGGVLSCWIYLSVQTSRRQTLFANQLGDTLTMVANALRAGFSFMQAMDLIAKEMPNPMGEEFHRVVQDIQVGSTQDDALERMAQRVGSADFNLVVTAVGIQRQVGGNLSYILDTISVTINDRIKMKREAKTLTSQGRASGMVLVALPFALAGILRFMDPTYFDPMLEHPMGPMIIGAAIVWMIIGIIAIQRIVDIDV